MVKSKHWTHLREVTPDQLRELKPEGFPFAKEQFVTASEKGCRHCGIRFWVPGDEKASSLKMSKPAYGPKACGCSKKVCCDTTPPDAIPPNEPHL